jgi:hypothetical protein
VRDRTRTGGAGRRAFGVRGSATRAGRLIGVALVMGLVASSARALPPPEKNWSLDLMPYGWMSWVSMDVVADGITKSYELPFFNSVINDLSWAIMGTVEFRYERALLLLDGFGNQLASSDQGPGRTQSFQTIFGPGQLTLGPAGASVRTTLGMVDAKLGFRALHLPLSKLFSSLPDDDPRRLDLDLFAGARYWNSHVVARAGVAPASLTVNGNPIGIGSLCGRLPDYDSGGFQLSGSLLCGGRHPDRRLGGSGRGAPHPRRHHEEALGLPDGRRGRLLDRQRVEPDLAGNGRIPLAVHAARGSRRRRPRALAGPPERDLECEALGPGTRRRDQLLSCCEGGRT